MSIISNGITGEKLRKEMQKIEKRTEDDLELIVAGENHTKHEVHGIENHTADDVLDNVILDDGMPRASLPKPNPVQEGELHSQMENFQKRLNTKYEYSKSILEFDTNKITLDKARIIANLKLPNTCWETSNMEEPYNDILFELMSPDRNSPKWIFQILIESKSIVGSEHLPLHHFQWFEINSMDSYYPTKNEYKTISSIIIK
jgi:hypothetical protein